MPSPTFTERRLWRNAYLLAGFQGAEGTPVSDFTTATVRSMLAAGFDFDPGVEKDVFVGAGVTSRRATTGRFSPLIRPTAALSGLATPRNIEWALRSFAGSWAGSPAMTLSFEEALSTYLTLALVEKAPAPNAQDLVRIWDVWAHRVALRMGPGPDDGPLVLEAEFAGRDYDRTPLNALGGITLPGSFAPPEMGTIFAPHQFRLYRDPAGANVSVAVSELEIAFESGVQQEHWADRKPRVRKIGGTSVAVRIKGSWSAETRAIVGDAESVLPTFKRFRAEWVSGSKSLVIDMKNLDLSAAKSGWNGREYLGFEAEGEAFLDAGSGTYVDVILTP